MEAAFNELNVAVVPVWHPGENRPTQTQKVPRPGAIRPNGGGRAHSPGTALPSVVWLLPRL